MWSQFFLRGSITRSSAKSRRKDRGRSRSRAAPTGVRAYVGVDAVTRKRSYLTETVPAGQAALAEIEQRRTLDQRRAAEEERAGQLRTWWADDALVSADDRADTLS